MKILKLVLVAGLFFTISCKETANEVKTETKKAEIAQIAPENLQKATFKVSGMTCEVGCANMIQTKLTEMEGMQQAEVNFEAEIATLSYDKTKQTPESITAMVENLADHAYKVSDFKVE